MEIQRDMGTYRLDLRSKEEDMRRLEQALAELERNKNDFLSRQNLCLEPEFTTATFHGENAKSLELFIRNTLKSAFTSVPERQISDAERTIRWEISVLKQNITSLGNSISSLENQYKTVSAERMEVLRNS